MKVNLEFDDENSTYVLMDLMVLAHLKNTKEFLDSQEELGNGESIVLDSVNILIGYFGK